jgi:hypothetical protein
MRVTEVDIYYLKYDPNFLFDYLSRNTYSLALTFLFVAMSCWGVNPYG